MYCLGCSSVVQRHVWKLHRLPEEVISARDPIHVEFHVQCQPTAENQDHGITAYHPQTDGQTERVNQEVEQVLQLL